MHARTLNETMRCVGLQNEDGLCIGERLPLRVLSRCFHNSTHSLFPWILQC